MNTKFYSGNLRERDHLPETAYDVLNLMEYVLDRILSTW
jgi:hypothetical protein